jgi:hypothetical protein
MYQDGVFEAIEGSRGAKESIYRRFFARQCMSELVHKEQKIINHVVKREPS